LGGVLPSLEKLGYYQLHPANRARFHRLLAGRLAAVAKAMRCPDNGQAFQVIWTRAKTTREQNCKSAVFGGF
jgi:hypothetical protein